MRFSIDYFLQKFEVIPSEYIGYNQKTGCAYGQCNGSFTEEGRDLTLLMSSIPNLTPSVKAAWKPYESTPARINNGETEQYQQPTPKERIMAALNDIKEMQIAEESARYIINTTDVESVK
jgi:hypothetical protein